MILREFELQIVRFLREISTQFTDALSQAVTFLGEEYALIVLLAVVYFILDKKKGEKIAFAIFASISLNNVLKGLFKAPRPFEVDPSIDAVRVETATGYSFPSGHSQNAGVTYYSIAHNYKKRWLTWTVIAVIVFIGLTRMTLGVHFPSDVLVGIGLGIGMAILCAKLYDTFATTFKKKMILYAIAVGVYVPFLLVFYLQSPNDLTKYRDFYISFSLFTGFILAMLLENKYVGFHCAVPLKLRLIRFAIGMVVVLAIQTGLKIIFLDLLLFDMIRYFSVSFVGLGLYPLLTKRWLFPSDLSVDQT
jgi:membrane-associated phospholipid phosphatase